MLACAMALAVIVGIAVATPGAPGNPGRAQAAETIVVDVGSDWFCSVAFEDGVCETAIQAGDSVEWNFVDGVHNALECGDNWSKGSSCSAAEWTSGPAVFPGGTFSRVFDGAGTFFYRCTIHPVAMNGTVVVSAASTPTPTPSPSPTPAATPSPTPTPSASPAPSPTPTLSASPAPSSTPTTTSAATPDPTTTPSPTAAPPAPVTSTPSPPPATAVPSPSPTTAPTRTVAPAATASASPQPAQPTETPAGGAPASLPNNPVLGAGELPSGGGWPWTSQRFDLVGLLFAINLPLAALSFSAFRWYLQRRSDALGG